MLIVITKASNKKDWSKDELLIDLMWVETGQFRDASVMAIQCLRQGIISSANIYLKSELLYPQNDVVIRWL